MRNYQNRTKDILLVLAGICFLLFMFRLWPLILVVLVVGGVVLSKRALVPKQETQERQPPIQEHRIGIIDDQDVWERKYEFAWEKISCLVEKEYPNAQWIWETPTWKESFQNGEDLYIRLNKDGGYKRARITLRDGFVSEMLILAEETGSTPSDEQKPTPTKSKDNSNSARIAFEWMETHLLALNDRCNEIIGQGKNELTLLSSELPEETCWEDICKELVKAGLEDVSILPSEGIKIQLE